MKKKSPTGKITNRRARHDYNLDDGLIVGVSLTGAETKSLRLGRGDLKGSYVQIKDDELWLFNATISGDNRVPVPEADQTRNRKLLAKRKEIEQLLAAKQQGRTIVPLEILTQGRYIKIRIAAGRGKKNYDKRQTIKSRDDARRAAAAIKKMS